MTTIHVIRLKPGQDLRNEIEAYVRNKNIQAGWISTCVGSLTQYNIRFANQTKGSKGKGYFEIISLTGTVSVNGSHLHIGISDNSGKCIGGHLLDENIIYTTAEIVISESKDFVFSRENDETTMFKELLIKSRD